MNFKYLYVLLLLFVVSFSYNSSLYANGEEKNTEIVERVADDIVTHIVAKGETVYSIAAAYYTTVEEIYKLNPNAEKGIKTGNKLKIRPFTKVTGYSSHLIESKETLFSVSRMYGLSVASIKKANPGLDEASFKIGRTIKIPKFEPNENSVDGGVGDTQQKYLVQKKETLYSISKAYNVSVEELKNANPSVKEGGLKEGMTLIIPSGTNQVNTVEVRPDASIIETPYADKGEVVKVGIFLPFLDSRGSVSKDKLAEYYEGFLLAVKSMKEGGLNAEVYTFDIGSEKNTKKLESLLETNEVRNLHLIVGGVSKQQVDVLSKFSKKTEIKYVIPFASSGDINTNSGIFQITSSHTSLYPEAINAFKEQYRNYNIIFVSEEGSNNDKSDFVNELKKELSKSNIQHKTTNASNDLTNEITKLLDVSKKNVLIPTSSTEATLRRTITAISSLDPEIITLFGYPDWQAYTQHRNALHKYDSHIYSIFFVDNQQKETLDFLQEYKNWYNKSLIVNFPRYGYLGYDMGLYFLTALNRFGSNFENNVSGMKVATLQSAIHFKRTNNKGGFINNGLYFVHYKTGMDIDKTDVSN